MAQEKDQNRRKYWQFFWRSWAIQDSWNYERAMNMGFLYGIAPTLDRIYKDPKDDALKKEAYQRHMLYYNCTPQTSAFVLGLTASMEEQYYEDQEGFNPDTINSVRNRPRFSLWFRDQSRTTGQYFRTDSGNDYFLCSIVSSDLLRREIRL